MRSKVKVSFRDVQVGAMQIRCSYEGEATALANAINKAVADARTQALDEAKAVVYTAANNVPDQDCTARAWDTAMLIVRVATESIEQLKEKRDE